MSRCHVAGSQYTQVFDTWSACPGGVPRTPRRSDLSINLSIYLLRKTYSFANTTHVPLYFTYFLPQCSSSAFRTLGNGPASSQISNAFIPKSFSMFGSAPYSRRIFTISTSPLSTARFNADVPDPIELLPGIPPRSREGSGVAKVRQRLAAGDCYACTGHT